MSLGTGVSGARRLLLNPANCLLNPAKSHGRPY